MRQLLIFLSFVLLVSCGQSSRHGTAARGGDTLRMHYATLLTVVRHKDYTQVLIGDPWKQGSVLQRYVLVPKSLGALPRGLPGGVVVRTPVERSVVFTTAHCQLLWWLGAQEAVKGVCDLKYIHIPELQEAVRQGRISDCGNGMAPANEKIIALKPEALLISPFENSGGHGGLDKTGIPIIETADYMERSALGRAEWMRFYGLLYGRERQADSLFQVVASEYQHLRGQARRMRQGRSVLTERMTGSVWYCAGGKSTVGQLIADAGGRYAFASDSHSGSVPLPFEQVLAKAGKAEVWTFKFDGDRPLTRADLLAEFHGYNGLEAFKSGEVYECNCSKTRYFEEVSFRPDWLLRDAVQLLHPGVNLGGLRYYQRMPQ